MPEESRTWFCLGRRDSSQNLTVKENHLNPPQMPWHSSKSWGRGGGGDVTSFLPPGAPRVKLPGGWQNQRAHGQGVTVQSNSSTLRSPRYRRIHCYILHRISWAGPQIRLLLSFLSQVSGLWTADVGEALANKAAFAYPLALQLEPLQQLTTP